MRVEIHTEKEHDVLEFQNPIEYAAQFDGKANFNWCTHPLNLRYRKAVRASVGDKSLRNPPTPVPTPEQRRSKELERAIKYIEAANAIRPSAETLAALGLLGRGD